MKTFLAVCVIGVGIATDCRAAMIPYDLLGKGGAGLLASNETGTVSGTPGSGGELGTGILFDDVTLKLTINVGWGTANGFTNLTGNAIAGHIHGATDGNAPTSFTQNASPIFTLDSLAGWNPSSSAGGFNGTVTLTSVQATQLQDGRFYLNFHTSTNGGGEIRGQLVPVPEPAAAALLVFGSLGLACKRRRASR
jgi:hypothetical protein